MNKALIAAITLCASNVVYAGGYIEGQLGYAQVSSVDIGPVTAPEFGTAALSLDYDNNFIYGLEVGFEGFEKHNVLRVGLSWNRFEADLDKASASITGGTDIGPISGSATSAELEAEGLYFDNTVDIFMANLYYDFPTEMKFKPYVSLGFGIADIENADDEEGTFSYSIGGRYEISEGTKLGIKLSHIQIDGPTDELGLSYNDIDVDQISITLSADF